MPRNDRPRLSVRALIRPLAAVAVVWSAVAVAPVAAHADPQTVTFGNLPAAAGYGTWFSIGATSEAGSANMVYSASGSCTMDGTSGVRVTSGSGTCELSAYEPGNTTYDPATGYASVPVTRAEQNPLFTYPPYTDGIYGDQFITGTVGGSTTGQITYSFNENCQLAEVNDAMYMTATITGGTGVCAVTATRPGDANYVDVSYTLTVPVNPRPLYLYEEDMFIVYGDPVPPLAWHLAGFVDGDNAANIGLTGSPVCAYTDGGTGGTRSGSYQFTCDDVGNLQATNYELVPQGFYATLGIAAAELTVTAADVTVFYGEAAVITASYAGFVNGDTPADLNSLPYCWSEAGGGGALGEFVSSCSGPQDTNYNLTFVDGTTYVVAAPQTITFDQPYSPAMYDTSFYIAPYSSGLPVTVTAAGGCTTVDEGGSWTVTMTSGTIDCVLTASQPGDGNFDPAESVIRTVAASRTWQDNMAILGPDSATYGDTFPVLVTGGTGDGQVTFAADGDGCTVVQSGDGSADVTMTTGSGTCYLVATIAADANYLENSRTLSIDATPATLNIDAGTVSKVAGANDPAMAWSLSGFVNGDTTAATLVSGAPNCQREVGETPGTYDALCYPASMSADNYTFGFGAFGSLTITARSAPTQTVAATAGTSTTIDALAPLGAGFVVASFDARSANGATITTAAGTFTYTAPTEFVGTDSFSYTVTDQFGNQTVVTVSIQVAAAGIAPLAVPAPTPQPAPTTPVLAPPTGQLPATGGDYATLLLTAVFALLVGFGLHIARRPS